MAAVLVICGHAPAAVAKDAPPLVSREHSITQSVTVKSIDLATRHMTITSPGGEDTTVKVPAEYRRLDQLKPGDRIKATYRVATDILLTAPGAAPPKNMAGTLAARSGESHAPGAGVANYVVVTGAVLAIDQARHTLKLVNPAGGEVHTVEVTHEDGKQAMSRLKVGDKITAYITESLLLSVTPA